MLGLVFLLIYFLSPVQAAEVVGKDGAPLVVIAEGPFLRAARLANISNANSLSSPRIGGCSDAYRAARGRPWSA